MRFLPLYVLIALLVGGCARETQKTLPPIGQTSTFPTDDLGRAVALKQPARRVVCIGPGATETIFALGAGDKLVGRDQFSNYPKTALKAPVAGDFSGPFPEKVIALRPDLVIVQGETYDAARAKLWEEKIGAPIAVLTASDVEGVAKGIEKIGAWLGAKNEAARIVKGFPAESKVPANNRARAFFEVQRSPLWAAGGSTLIDSVMRKAGVQNIAEIKGYKAYSLEKLITQNPDFYIVAGENSDKARAMKELQNAPTLKNLACIRSGRVVVLHSDWALRPGPRLPLGIRELSDQIASLNQTRK